MLFRSFHPYGCNQQPLCQPLSCVQLTLFSLSWYRPAAHSAPWQSRRVAAPPTRRHPLSRASPVAVRTAGSPLSDHGCQAACRPLKELPAAEKLPATYQPGWVARRRRPRSPETVGCLQLLAARNTEDQQGSPFISIQSARAHQAVTKARIEKITPPRSVPRRPHDCVSFGPFSRRFLPTLALRTRPRGPQRQR